MDKLTKQMEKNNHKMDETNNKMEKITNQVGSNNKKYQKYKKMYDEGKAEINKLTKTVQTCNGKSLLFFCSKLFFAEFTFL